MADYQKLAPLPYGSPVVNSAGVLTPQAQDFFEVIFQRSLTIGQGSPEGNVQAQKGAEYMDEAGAPGSIKWIKQFDEISGDTSKGWTLI